MPVILPLKPTPGFVPRISKSSPTASPKCPRPHSSTAIHYSAKWPKITARNWPRSVLDSEVHVCPLSTACATAMIRWHLLNRSHPCDELCSENHQSSIEIMQKDMSFAPSVLMKARFSSRSACAGVAKTGEYWIKVRHRRPARHKTVLTTVHAATYDPTARKQVGPKKPNVAQRLAVFFAALFVVLPAPLHASPSRTADILLKSGTIIDGTGHDSYEADVAIADGRITRVGKSLDQPARQTIDCKGLVIAPGFIDLHNHSDETITTDNGHAARCYLTQGCTTLVTGNCGGGRADVGAFYKELDAKGTGINIAQLIPAGSVREKVMGNVRREPTAAELKQMQELTEAAMQDGAWGISTGLQYVPGSSAKTDEIIALAQVAALRAAFYASHIRDEGDTLIESIQEVIDVGRGANIQCHVSHFKSTKKPNWGKVRAAAHLIEDAQKQGLKITADQYPYTTSSTSIMAILQPAAEREGGEKAPPERLKDTKIEKRLRPIVERTLSARGPIMRAPSRKN